MNLQVEDMYEVQEYKGITLTLPLDDDTRKYLYSRGKDPLVAELDAQYTNYQFRVNELKAAGEWDDDEEAENEELPPYEAYTKAELIDEINDRNKERADDDKIDASGKKEDLVARLYADDELADASA
jgi:hypothetical protein